MSKLWNLIAFTLVSLGLAAAPPAVTSALAAPARSTAAADHQAAPLPPRAADSTARDDARYAARERKAPELEKFEGGRQVVIVTSVLTIVLVVIILVLVL